ncbi:hypothetical protein COO60DRAFT_1490198 [Scenedesmus sp. NREL 46B-D3]|nr:hypothetical protein COO60DRAFT_1490198 [Scenedesmus sp. NREL 46B-D3]
MGPWRASCLLLVGLLLVSASRDDEAPLQIKSLALDGQAVQAFISQFGAAQKMTPRQIEIAYDRQYVPDSEGPDFGVPKVVTAGLRYRPWKDSMHCQNYGCFNPSPNPPPYFPTIYDWASNNPDQRISTQIMDLIGEEVFQGPFTGTLFLPTDAAWSTYLARWQTPIVNTTRAEEFYANFFIRLLQYHTLLLRVYGSQLDGFRYSTVYSNLNAFPHKVTFGASTGCSGGNCSSGCNSCNSGCTAGCAPPQGCTTCSGWYGNGGWSLGKHGKKSHYFYSPGPYHKFNYKGYYPPCSGGDCSQCSGPGCGGGCGTSGGCGSTPCSGGGCGSTPCSGGGCGSTSPCSGSGCQQQQRKPCSGSGCGQKQACQGQQGGSDCSGGGCDGGGCSSGGCSSGGCGGGCSGGGGCGGGCGGPANFLIDEQRNVVTFNAIDKFVFGGGVIHTINSVLEPSDIFPSLTAAINSSAVFSDLRITLDRINNEGNFSLLPTLEEIPGTMALPNNAAFAGAGVDVETAPVNDLLNVVAYHFCAFTRAYRLLYYPFKGRPGKNPCLTILSRAYQISYGLAWNATNPGITQTPDMWINFATGVYPNGLRVQRANIVTADITTPVHSAAEISDLLVPPSNLPANRAMAAGAGGVSGLMRAQLAATVQSASLTAKLAQERRGDRPRSSRRKQRRAENRAAGGADRATELDVDADEDDTQARSVRSPAQLARNAADLLLVSPRGPR